MSNNKIWISLLAVLLLVNISSLQAQSYLDGTLDTPLYSSTSPFLNKVLFWGLLIPQEKAVDRIPSSLSQFRSWSVTKGHNTYKMEELAFFCRLEVQLEKVTKIPVRFRIGDVQQVDYLEGKFEGWRYGY